MRRRGGVSRRAIATATFGAVIALSAMESVAVASGTSSSEVRPAVAPVAERALPSAAETAADLEAAFARAEPRTLAAGDFDGDGMPDLAASYSTESGSLGLVALWRGNVDAVYGWSEEARRRRAEGTFTDAPFLGPPPIFVLPEAADFLAAGDFDGDGGTDLAAAALGGEAIYLLSGDGRGRLAAAETIRLPGRVTAWAAGEVNRRDGLEDLVVAIDGVEGARLMVFEGPNGALRWEPEVIALADRAEDLAVGWLDGDIYGDVAVAGGEAITVLQGRNRHLSHRTARRAAVPTARAIRHVMSFVPRALAIGDFIPDEDHRREIAVLDEEGWVHFLGREVASEESATAQEVIAQSSAGWKVARGVSIGRWEYRQGTRPMLVKTSMTTSSGDGVLVLGGGAQELVFARRDGSDSLGKESLPTASQENLAGEKGIVAAVPMRLNRDGFEDVVALEEVSNSPSVILSATAETFTVDSKGDTGDSNPGDGSCDTGTGVCTLRAAIQEANAHAGVDTIEFSIDPYLTPFIPRVISPGAGMTAITDPVTLDATTQIGDLVLSGSNAGSADGLVVTAGSTLIRGLLVRSYSGHAISLWSDSNIVEGNEIGRTRSSLFETHGNGVLGIQISGGSNLIGGTTAAARNVISGNGTNSAAPTRGGVGLVSGPTSSNVISGNYIGLDSSGTLHLPNQVYGILVEDGASTLIGGTTNGSRNVVAGDPTSIEAAILIKSAQASGATVQGNYVGLDSSGTVGMPATYGVRTEESEDLLIGGTTAAARNVISGASSIGVDVYVPGPSPPVDVKIQGNYVGTDKTGAIAVPNVYWGINVRANGALIGGSVPGAGNLVSGNGIGIESDEWILGNLIGTNATGDSPLPNTSVGVESWRVGDGTEEGSNRIAHNLGQGIRDTSILTQTVDYSTSRRRYRRNEIFSNEGLGIDLGPKGGDGVSLNSTVGNDLGPDNPLNYPVLTSLNTTGGVTTIEGTLNSVASTVFSVDLYSNAQCDASGYGEAENWLGTIPVTTNAGGAASFAFFASPALPAGFYVTANSALPDRTSEFSMCRRENGTCPYPPDLVLTDAQIIGPQAFTACETITTTGEITVGLFSSADFTAGESVAFGNGLGVFGDLTVAIDPTLSP